MSAFLCTDRNDPRERNQWRVVSCKHKQNTPAAPWGLPVWSHLTMTSAVKFISQHCEGNCDMHLHENFISIQKGDKTQPKSDISYNSNKITFLFFSFNPFTAGTGECNKLMKFDFSKRWKFPLKVIMILLPSRKKQTKSHNNYNIRLSEHFCQYKLPLYIQPMGKSVLNFKYWSLLGKISPTRYISYECYRSPSAKPKVKLAHMLFQLNWSLCHSNLIFKSLFT